jgi:hypothetical protein
MVNAEFYWGLVIGYWLIGNWLLVIGDWLIGNSLVDKLVKVF